MKKILLSLVFIFLTMNLNATNLEKENELKSFFKVYFKNIDNIRDCTKLSKYDKKVIDLFDKHQNIKDELDPLFHYKECLVLDFSWYINPQLTLFYLANKYNNDSLFNEAFNYEEGSLRAPFVKNRPNILDLGYKYDRTGDNEYLYYLYKEFPEAKEELRREFAQEYSDFSFLELTSKTYEEIIKHNIILLFLSLIIVISLFILYKKEGKTRKTILFILFSVIIYFIIIILYRVYSSYLPFEMDYINEGFYNLINILSREISSNSGKLLSSLGIILSIVLYINTKKKKILFFGVIISLVIGGWIGISEIFFDAAKPIIYIYPKKQMDINVSLKINGEITKSIPKYNNGWKVNIEPSGRINKKYDSLFYENNLKYIDVPNQGWIVEKSELKEWFKNRLTAWNFSEKEMNEFIEYWVPRLNKETDTKYIDIRLFTNKFLKKNMRLIISPKPDNIYRYEFVFKGVNRKVMLSSPIVKKIDRKGYFAVEWGGGFDIN